MKIINILFLLVSPALFAAETIGFWEFEGNNFLKDSVGENHLHKTGEAQQLHDKVAYFNGNGALLADGPLMTTPQNFTIEGYFASYKSNAKRRIIAGTYLPTDRGWEIYVEEDGNLVMEIATNQKTGQYYVSNLKVKANTSYFFAATVHRWGLGKKTSRVTFYLKEIDDGPLQREVVTRYNQWGQYTSKNGKFSIGGRANPKTISFMGSIDDIRLSKGLVAEAGLLVNQE